MNWKLPISLIFVFCIQVFFAQNIFAEAAAVSNPKPFTQIANTNENFTFSLGLSYSKLETYTAVGNFYILSQTNPRLQLTYETSLVNSYRSFWHLYYTRENFIPENPNFFLRNKSPLNRYGLIYQPQWFSENAVFSYGFNFHLKSANIYSEEPNTLSLIGNIDQRYSYEAGIALKWYGQTVSKLPLSLSLDFSYVNQFAKTSPIQYSNGYVYRMSIDFDFGKRSYFSNFNLKAFYEYEKVTNDLEPLVAKDLGLSLGRTFSY